MNRCLQDDPELLVVDNASTDRVGEALARWRGPSRFIALTENVGFGAASNVGVAEAEGEVTVLLNPDTELLDDGLDRLAATAAELRALVGPRLLNTDGSVQPSASGPPVGAWPWVGALLPGTIQPDAVRAHTEPYRLERRLRVSWLTGACVAAPTALLRELGPFDTALHMFSEDVDLGLRAAAAGASSWFDPDSCRIVHHGQASSTLAYGSRDGYRPTAALNRRAAVRRAYGPRREWLAWRAMRLNLRLRLAAKTLLGRATERDRAAVRAAVLARRAPELPEPRSKPLQSGS
jgi:GT2 family glycosyltransferase